MDPRLASRSEPSSNLLEPPTNNNHKTKKNKIKKREVTKSRMEYLTRKGTLWTDQEPTRNLQIT